MNFLNLFYMDFSYKRSMSLKIRSEVKEKAMFVNHFIAYEMLISKHIYFLYGLVNLPGDILDSI